MGDAQMTQHLGGPETPEKIRERHERYLALKDPARGAMLVIITGPSRDPVGSIGYWDKEWSGETVWETGWSVLPEHQGHGIATAAIPLVVEQARATGLRRSIHAFPAVDNGPSNAICRKAGFTLMGAFDLEYPPGHPLRCNDWMLEAE
jgi:RimJ/RimL family protein N-acetyltransferase